MSCVGDITVTKQFDFHLSRTVCPRVEVNLTALIVKGKIENLNFAICVQSNLGYPGNRTVVVDPRIEMPELS